MNLGLKFVIQKKEIFHSTTRRNRFLKLFYYVSHEMEIVYWKRKPIANFCTALLLKNADDESIPFLSVEINFKKREQNYHKFDVNHFSLCLNYYTRTFICVEVIDRRNEVVTIASSLFFHTLMACCACNSFKSQDKSIWSQ